MPALYVDAASSARAVPATPAAASVPAAAADATNDLREMPSRAIAFVLSRWGQAAGASVARRGARTTPIVAWMMVGQAMDDFANPHDLVFCRHSSIRARVMARAAHRAGDWGEPGRAVPHSGRAWAAVRTLGANVGHPPCTRGECGPCSHTRGEREPPRAHSARVRAAHRAFGPNAGPRPSGREAQHGSRAHRPRRQPPRLHAASPRTKKRGPAHSGTRPAPTLAGMHAHAVYVLRLRGCAPSVGDITPRHRTARRLSAVPPAWAR